MTFHQNSHTSRKFQGEHNRVIEKIARIRISDFDTFEKIVFEIIRNNLKFEII